MCSGISYSYGHAPACLVRVMRDEACLAPAAIEDGLKQRKASYGGGALTAPPLAGPRMS